jgi:hypothetical protein
MQIDTSALSSTKPLVYIIDKCFSEKECRDILSQDLVFNDYQTNKLGETYLDKNIRSDKCAVLQSPELLSLIKERIATVIPEKEFILNSLMRISHYNVGDICKPHFDHVYTKDNFSSKYTVILYLNNVNSGGVTRLFSAETMEKIDITSIIGRVVLFDQSISHTGAPVTDGEKYNLRTDILVPNLEITKKDPETIPVDFSPFPISSHGSLTVLD